MTRFARAKGSKASNERAPEDATPWAVMKEQLQHAKEEAEHNKLREQAEKQRMENYENFLNDRKTAKRKITWCEFPEEQNKSQKNKDEQIKKKSKLNMKSNETNEISNSRKHEKFKQKKKGNEQNHRKNEVEKTEKSALSLPAESECNFNKKKKKKKSQNKTFDDENDAKITNETLITPSEDLKPPKKKNKKNKKHSEFSNSDHSEKPSDIEPSNKKHKHNANVLESTKNTADKSDVRIKKKNCDGTKQRRKPVTDNSFQIIINGREVDLVRFEGFPVMTKDAERLRQLRKDMAAKGIPKKEIDRTMKLERRRAEKALARIKRDVCYNCRKGGHNISSCPDLRSLIPDRPTDNLTDGLTPQIDMPDGICFKCGSTEHRQSECKVQKDQQFRFASCFICKEQGHIARQCPDNPKGLYPNGGGCKLCGDVTHLRKDCPTTKTTKEESSVRLDTLASSEKIEEVSVDSNVPQIPTSSKKPKKITF